MSVDSHGGDSGNEGAKSLKRASTSDEATRAEYLDLDRESREVQRRSTEAFDQHVLTLSSAGLGLSMAFITDIVGLENAAHVWMLVTSWGAFGVAILATMFSFIASYYGWEGHREILRKVYSGDDSDTVGQISEASRAARLTHRLNLLSAIAFGLAIFLTILFTSINVLSATS